MMLDEKGVTLFMEATVNSCPKIIQMKGGHIPKYKFIKKDGKRIRIATEQYKELSKPCLLDTSRRYGCIVTIFEPRCADREWRESIYDNKR